MVYGTGRNLIVVLSSLSTCIAPSPLPWSDSIAVSYTVRGSLPFEPRALELEIVEGWNASRRADSLQNRVTWFCIGMRAAVGPDSGHSVNHPTSSRAGILCTSLSTVP